MAERLTKKISKPIQDKYSLGNYLYYDFAEIDDTNKLLNKLGKLEDIMDKYGIESFELLEHIIKKGKAINPIIEDFSKEEIIKAKQDRDNWKNACELACKELNKYIDNKCEYCCYKELNEFGSCDCDEQFELKRTIQYFYQQAKIWREK